MFYSMAGPCYSALGAIRSANRRSVNLKGIRMVTFVHVGTLSDVLSDIRDWLDSGRELLSDLVDYVDDEQDGEDGEDEDGEDGEDEGDEDEDGEDEDGEGDDIVVAYNDGYDDAAAAIIGAVGDYVVDNPGVTVADVITFLKGEFQ